MRSLNARLESHVTETLPRVAEILGDGWRASRLALRGPDQRHLSCHLKPPDCRELMIFADVDHLEEPLQVELAATAPPEVIARALEADLLPRYTPPSASSSASRRQEFYRFLTRTRDGEDSVTEAVLGGCDYEELADRFGITVTAVCEVIDEVIEDGG